MQNPLSIRSLRSVFLLAMLAVLGLGLASAAVVQVGASDNGGAIKVKKGDIVELTLPTNASTGYDWTILPASTTLLKLQTHTSKRSPGGQLGAPGMSTFRFITTAKGSGNLSMEYARSWEHSPTTDKKFALRVDIQ
jgi:inhibitor of cysteine peptidase